jgi:glycerate-2-kinase
LNAALIAGQTGTNVNDLKIILIGLTDDVSPS